MADLSTIGAMTDDDFHYFRDIVYRETGINMSDLKRALLQSRLLRRLRCLDLKSYAEYRRYLGERYDEELILFINAVTTNKTDFFREEQHFDYLKEKVLPEVSTKGKDRIRIWSAGCSTGEEPYSIAMTVLDYYKGHELPDVKILATDIDTQVLHHAVEGVYKADSLQDVDLQTARAFFLKGSGSNDGSFRVKNSVKSLVTFKRLNLLDFNYPMNGVFDAIFCRNVIIYFDKNTQRQLFDYLYRFLSDDGYLFIGHSENLSSVSEKYRCIGKTIYRKVV
jgi:chemotaxis protein methyltransferase CheR